MHFFALYFAKDIPLTQSHHWFNDGGRPINSHNVTQKS